MNQNRIGNFEAVSFILIILINHIILNLPTSIIASCGSSSLINIVFVFIIAFLITFLVSKLLKNFPNSNILDISNFLGGKIFKFIIGILFLIYFILIGSILLRSFCENLKIIYFQRTSISLILAMFFIGVLIVNKLNFKAIIRSSMLVLPIILFSIFFIFISNLKNFTFESIFPILGNGFNPTFLSGMSNIFAFAGIAFIYFLPPLIAKQEALKKVSLISICISGIYLLLSVATLLFMFPVTLASEEIMPLYLASRYIEFGSFFQRLDAIFLLIWILSILSYISIVTGLCIMIFKEITNIKNTKPLTSLFCLLFFSVCLIPKTTIQLKFIENTIYKYFVLILVFGISIITLILANLKFKKLNKNRGDV